MEDCAIGILGNSQTYIGVLATFVVLCLFIGGRRSANKKNAESSSDEYEGGQNESSNFIFGTIMRLADDSDKLLKDFLDKLNNEIKTIYEPTKREEELVDELTEKYPNREKDIYENRLQVSLIQFKFMEDVTESVNLFSGSFLPFREELALVALYTLFLIISVFFWTL